MQTSIRYDITFKGMDSSAFSVVHFRGQESLSQLYSYHVSVRHSGLDLDADALLSRYCSLTISVGNRTKTVHGILANLDVNGCADGALDLSLTLVPRLWQLGLFRLNEVYLGDSVPDITKRIMEEAGFSTLDYELRLFRQYRKWPYRCQYGETHLEFLIRIYSREGIYFYFEQTAEQDKVIITDSLYGHGDIDAPTLTFSPESGLDWQHQCNVMRSMIVRRKRLVRKAILRDYNDEKPSADIIGEVPVDPQGMGEMNVYGLNIDSPDEAKRLAQVAAESLLWEKQTLHAETYAANLAPGFLFGLEQHPLSAMNRRYHVVSLETEGWSTTQPGVDGQSLQPFMLALSAVPADIQYRPAMAVDVPKIHGALDAMIDAEGEGEYAELDSQGRYKVVLPFDRQSRDAGKASHWVRMSQAFAGEVEGMHFPMRKGSRVLLSFVGGDPDRPVITGAMPNAAQPSVVTADNQTKSKIQTRAGNLIEIEDKSDSNRIKLYSPHQNTYFHMGASNHPGDGLVFITDGIERREIKGGYQHTYLTRDVLTSAGSLTTSGTQSATASDPTGGVNLIDEQSIFAFSKLSTAGSSTGAMTGTDELSGNYNTSRQVGPSYRYTSGDQFNYIENYRTFRFGAEYSEIHAVTASGDKGKDPANSFDFPASVGGAIGLTPSTSQQQKLFSDTLSYQSGRNYSWGDTCDYEFGNSYTETYPDITASGAPSIAINSNQTGDLAGTPTTSGFSRTAINGSSVTIADIGKAQVEKLFGHSYAFQQGNAIDVAMGNAESRRVGHEYQYLSGDSSTYLQTAHTNTTVASAAYTSNSTFNSTCTENNTYSGTYSENISFGKRSTSNVTYLDSFYETHTMASYGTLATFKHINGNLTEYNAVSGAVNQMRAVAGAQSEMGVILGVNIRTEATLGARLEFDFTGGLHLDIGTAPFKIEIDEDNQKIKVVALGAEWGQHPPLKVRNVLVGIVTGGLNLYL